MDQIFYDVVEQTNYYITISCPENPEDLSDFFISYDELKDLVGESFYHYSRGERKIKLRSVISAECVKWAEKLEASGKKTIKIEDQELVEVLRDGYLSNYMPDCDTTYCRRGDRIGFSRSYKRVKKKPTKGDVLTLWNCLQNGFYDKFGCYPPHIPLYSRHLAMFEAFKKIVGWRLVRSYMPDKKAAKFCRQIWDNPKEFIK